MCSLSANCLCVRFRLALAARTKGAKEEYQKQKYGENWATSCTHKYELQLVFCALWIILPKRHCYILLYLRSFLIYYKKK